MRITVIGASGQFGRRISDRLEARGHEVVRAHRGVGVDAYTGVGLREAITGADVVVDALNMMSLSKRKAVDFFTTTARNVGRAAEEADVGRVVVVSIFGADKPATGRFFGYYAAKAAQRREYERGSTPVTLLLSTQWFELAEAIAEMASVGPVTVLPTMRMAPLSVDAAAEAGADAVEDPDAGPRVVVRGEHDATLLEVAQAVVRERGEIAGRMPRVLTQAPYLGRALAAGALVPERADVVVSGGVREWLASQD